MRKPDPARFSGRAKSKPDKLEMKGFSAPLAAARPLAPPRKQASRTTIVPQSRSAVVQKSASAEVQQYSTPSLDKLDDYPLLDFREYKKIDARLTWDQKEYLDKLENLIARGGPGMEQSNPLSKRITRSSILRALVEIARRLQIVVDPAHFQNERDLLAALVAAFEQKFKEREVARLT